MKGRSEVDPNPTVTQTGPGTPQAQRTLGSPDATLVTLLIRQPQMIERLAEAHANDGHGRCRSYSAGTGRYLFPCPVRLAVDEACRQLQAQTPRRGPVPCDAGHKHEGPDR